MRRAFRREGKSGWESYGGEVLLISEDHKEMMVYRVYRWVSEEGKWASVTSLGRRTLFLD
jgi:hypothetical protein